MTTDNSYSKSVSNLQLAKELIPSCTQTFSKGYTQFPYGAAPIFLESGKGSHVWDVDGNEFIDYAMALGPVILGHSNPAVNQAIVDQLGNGITYSLPHRLEVEVAGLLREIIPCAEMTRFGKNGSDATSGAVRAARAYTGREKIACCGYHGWQDWYIGTTTRNKGVPAAVQKLTLTFAYNNIESLKKLFDENKREIAAVIMEPVGVIEPAEGFLASVRDIAHENGALLIFDEIVTGFRLALGGAQEYFGVVPDLACVGKAMANGMPLSAVVGKKEIMEVFDEIFFSFTFGGEVLSLAAAKETIAQLRRDGVITHLWEMGGKLKRGYNELTRAHGLDKITECIGLSPRTVITFQDAGGHDPLVVKTLFQQEAIGKGVLCSGPHNICYAHSPEDIDFTLAAYDHAMKVTVAAIKSGDFLKFIKGEIVQPVFRKA
jgi:glutamate-1-semialdehyde 2,1-aminomutase/spore coat polysaccharide biosynthesis protein SpsF